LGFGYGHLSSIMAICLDCNSSFLVCLLESRSLMMMYTNIMNGVE